MNDTTVTIVLRSFLDNWVFPQLHFELDPNQQRTSVYCRNILIRMRSSWYRVNPDYRKPSQCNGQTEQYNKFVAARLRHYVSDQQTDWDLYI